MKTKSHTHKKITDENEESTNARNSVNYGFSFSESPYFHILNVTPQHKIYLMKNNSFNNYKCDIYA